MTPIDIIIAGLRPIEANIDDVEEKKLKERDREWYLDNGWIDTKCFHCGCYLLAKNWHTPPSCPRCHWSRTD